MLELFKAGWILIGYQLLWKWFQWYRSSVIIIIVVSVDFIIRAIIKALHSLL